MYFVYMCVYMYGHMWVSVCIWAFVCLCVFKSWQEEPSIHGSNLPAQQLFLKTPDG